MGRAYAGVLGSLGMGVAFARGAILGGGIEATATTAVVAMLALALVGLVVGQIAEATVDEAVRQRLQNKIEEHEAREA
ncbi:hypothetical protein [Botrimarina sp.]|uniref:hypothetical protein n=1 Tax=Botrimarina sp. TaxID=2795802 RepID=UPI0032EB9FF9